MKTSKHTDPMHFRRHGYCRTFCSLCNPLKRAT